MYFDWRRIGLVATLTDQGGRGSNSFQNIHNLCSCISFFRFRRSQLNF